MAAPEQDVYQELIDHWKQTWWGMPDVITAINKHINANKCLRNQPVLIL